MRFPRVRLLVLLAVIPFVGCDDGNDAPDLTELDAGPLVDRCLAQSDMDIILASRVDAGPIQDSLADPRVAMAQCVTTPECLPLALSGQLEDAAYCVRDCFLETPSGGISYDCRVCYYIWLNCAATNCTLECLGASSTDAGTYDLCYDCAQTHCQADLDTCVGF